MADICKVGFISSIKSFYLAELRSANEYVIRTMVSGAQNTVGVSVFENKGGGFRERASPIRAIGGTTNFAKTH